jgi:hypothetical protein
MIVGHGKLGSKLLIVTALSINGFQKIAGIIYFSVEDGESD